MRALIQRVSNASVDVEGKTVGEINKGILVFLGVGKGDTENELEYMVDKIINLRIFEDEDGKMNLSLKDIGGEILVVSQFTLYGDVSKGRRPSFTDSGDPKLANDLYELFIDKCKEEGIKTESGVFGADMDVKLLNQGPVTILVERESNL